MKMPYPAKWILVGVCSVLVLSGLTAMGYMVFRRETKRWTVVTDIGSNKAEVEIVHSYRPGIMFNPHTYLIHSGAHAYRVNVKIESGFEFVFSVGVEPVAIWQVDGSYYVACKSAGEAWLIARLAEDGRLIPVRRRDLPKGRMVSEGRQVWNLVSVDAQEEYQYKFDQFAP
jgi:hypothetical protein